MSQNLSSAAVVIDALRVKFLMPYNQFSSAVVTIALKIHFYGGANSSADCLTRSRSKLLAKVISRQQVLTCIKRVKPSPCLCLSNNGLFVQLLDYLVLLVT